MAGKNQAHLGACAKDERKIIVQVSLTTSLTRLPWSDGALTRDK